ncbi:hypothetical protein VTK56DRAFT_6522 [Thermocarpiscus australiensis]
MSKRTVFTTITPLPAGVTRQVVLDFLHNHEEMINLNPLVKERHPIPTPPHAPADEQDCRWYSLTDKISYLPGGLMAGNVTYTCAFHDLPSGLQTHCYAPAGLTIRDKWTVGGSLPGEPAPPVELGLRVPPTGLYLREDVEMRCNVIMTSFVRKTLKKSHAALVDRLKIKAQIASTGARSRSSGSRGASSEPDSLTTSTSMSSRTSSISSPYHHHQPQPVSALSTRPASAASAASSVSSYSVQDSPLWSSLPSSLITSPALSAQGPPAKYSSQFQHGPGAYVAAAELPATHPNPVPRSVSIPATESRPDGPFLQQQQQQQQQQPNWPLKTPSQGQTTPPARGGETGALSDDALWQALGGGRQRLAAPRNVVSHRANNGSSAAASCTRGTQNGQGHHPDYPQMSPYDDDDVDDDGGAGAGAGETGLGVRPLSMPSRATAGPVANELFIAGLD